MDLWKNLLDSFEPEQLLRFFHRHKTEMSCMSNPSIFVSQLRDHDLIPEDKYKKIDRMKSKDNIKRALYDILDWLERERPKRIKSFWSCVFNDTILNHYPTLQVLRNSLMDGSFQFGTQQSEGMENEESDEERRTPLSEELEEEEEMKMNSVKKKKKKKKKRKQGSRIVDSDEGEQAGPSSEVTSRKRNKSKKICFSSPLKKGEQGNIWTWPIYKVQLPVTCGKQEGILNRDRLAKGDKCILVKKVWFTPSQFERFSAKGSYRNWKLSIRCMGTPLGKLIKEGHLESVRYKGGRKMTKKFFPSDDATTACGDRDENEECDLDEEDQVSSSSRENSTDFTDEEEEEETEEQAEQEPEGSHDSSKKVFKVTCGALAGTLHAKRFASGTCGKSIRTETSWMTPVEFMNTALSHTNGSWRKDIKWEGKPLGVLTETNILMIHLLLCRCKLCRPDPTDLENQRNDDECCICKDDEDDLVVCDNCPRSFHQRCHLPHVEDMILRDPGQWMCTFCVFISNREYFYELKRDVAMSIEISQRMLGCQYLLLCLCCADEEQTFAKNPNLYLKDYSAVIKTPMWFGKVADKLQRQVYQTVGEFVSDIQLIFTNCASYNQGNPEFLDKGKRLKDLFDREFNNVFNICD